VQRLRQPLVQAAAAAGARRWCSLVEIGRWRSIFGEMLLLLLIVEMLLLLLMVLISDLQLFLLSQLLLLTML
jgi:hypothetical protein